MFAIKTLIKRLPLGVKSSDYVGVVPIETWQIIPTSSLCHSYPTFVQVPVSSVTDDQLTLLQKCSKFRSEGRLPVLSYYDMSSKRALCRAAQPLSGLRGKSNSDLVHVRNIAGSENKRLLVADLRPRINAVANRAQGKGYESEKNYEFADCVFCGLDNIHVIRDAWFYCFAHLKPPQKFQIASLNDNISRDTGAALRVGSQKFKLLSPNPIFLDDKKGDDKSDSGYHHSSAMSSWHRHVHSLLAVSEAIATSMKSPDLNTGNVLVHCSDGWDRTSQVCCLVQLIINPECRTLDGFHALIQRQWLDFGFKFSSRCSQTNCFSNATGDESISSRDMSPIWIQFLETVYQLLMFNQNSFEFNENFLIDLHEIASRFDYADFRGDTRAERTSLIALNPNLKVFFQDDASRKVTYLSCAFC